MRVRSSREGIPSTRGKQHVQFKTGSGDTRAKRLNLKTNPSFSVGGDRD